MIINNLTNRPIYNFFTKELLTTEDIFAKALKQCEIFEITNVVDYMYQRFEEDLDREWSIAEDIPNFTPPFPNTWFEWTCDGHRTGVLVVKKQNEIINCNILTQIDKNKLLFLMGFNLKLNEEGKVIQISSPYNCDDIYIQALAKFSVLFCGIAISFMHCKNAEIINNIPPKKLQKARKKRNKKPMVEYKTLKIEPMKTIQKNKQIQKAGYEQALHVCRGHFKDYRNGKGLFGKYKGLYWWDWQERGNRKEGKIKKTYEINLNKK